MSGNSVIPLDARDEFWDVVMACLREFHQTPPTQARNLVEQLRRRVDNPLDGSSPDLFYHSEPFDIACDLAQHKLDVRTVLGRYLQLRDG